MKKSLSVSDLAVVGISDDEDQLEIRDYARTLSDFILQCQTPLTIGVQGEWGSGKTSLINMVEKHLDSSNEENKGDRVYSLQINTWEHSLLQTPEGTLLSIIQEIIDSLIGKNDEKQDSTAWTQEFGQVMKRLAGSAAWVGLAAIGGAAVLNAARQEQDKERATGAGDAPVRENIIKKLRENLSTLTNSIKSQEGNFDRFVIFIDDLDRLEPPVAVAVLELLKNIFNIPHTVFVLAIDYQVVVKGLKHKFGNLTPDNEREFRSFFDKIIQVPFMMPMGDYKLETYVKHLLEQIGYFKGELKADELSKLTKVVRQTIGRNPRSLKRLTNSLALIALQNKEKLKDNEKRKLLFCMVCFQIGFPNVFEILLLDPNFPEWTEEGAWRFIRSKGKEPNPKNFDQEWEAIAAGSDDIFEDSGNSGEGAGEDSEDSEENAGEWQRALFRVVWVMDWQKTRVTETVEVLKNIYEELIQKNPDNAQDLLKDVLRLAGTTSVISWDTTPSSNEIDEESQDLKKQYWRKFYENVSGTPFATGKKMRKAGMTSWEFKRDDPDMDGMNWVSKLNSTSFLTLQGKGPRAKLLFKEMKDFRRSEKLGKKMNCSLTFHVNLEDSAANHKLVIRPTNLEQGLRLFLGQNERHQEVAMNWLREQFRGVRKEIFEIWEERVEPKNEVAGQEDVSEESSNGEN